MHQLGQAAYSSLSQPVYITEANYSRSDNTSREHPEISEVWLTFIECGKLTNDLGFRQTVVKILLAGIRVRTLYYAVDNNYCSDEVILDQHNHKYVTSRNAETNHDYLVGVPNTGDHKSVRLVSVEELHGVEAQLGITRTAAIIETAPAL